MMHKTMAVLLLALAVSRPASAEMPGPACPTGGAVQRATGLTVTYLGARAANLEICRVRRGGDDAADFYFGIWATAWPGADAAYPALKQVLSGAPGSSARFDTRAAPGLAWHETLRNEGRETMNLLGRAWDTVKIAHEREGFDGNTYHSVITSWRDTASGMTIYQNYQHISGRPEPGGQWEPTAISTAP